MVRLESLAVAVALTGILATMPYIGLQLIGLKTVIAAMGISGDWPIIIAFVVLAAYTYQSGLRARHSPRSSRTSRSTSR